MHDLRPVFIADTCIGGLSVIKSMWNAGSARDAVFLADYEVNPLGLKSDTDIADVVQKWLGLAEQHSNTLVIACNTLSVRYHQLQQSTGARSGLKRVVSMVDCFESMVKKELGRLATGKVLVIGTEFTASQAVYPDILSANLPGIRISTYAATELERRIARFLPLEDNGISVLTGTLGRAIESTDFVVLACTCFPMVQAELEALYPHIVFIDPGTYCEGLLGHGGSAQNGKLRIMVTGDIVSEPRVREFAHSYLATEPIEL